MADTNIQYTSDFVCDNIARRVVAGFGQTAIAKSASALNQRFVVPMMTRMVISGKLKRGTVIQQGKSLQRTIAALPPVVACSSEFEHVSRLSSREVFRLHYIMAVSNDTGAQTSDWVEFVCSETYLTRRTMELSQTSLDLKLHRHALARFMGRELQGSEAMLRDMEGAHHLAFLMAGLLQLHGGGDEIALPIGDDAMLYGRVEATPKSPREMKRIRISRERPEQWTDYREEVAIQLPPSRVKIMTYISGTTLNPAREALRDLLLDWQRQHGKACAEIFGIAHYPNWPLSRLEEDHPEFDQRVEPLVLAIRDLKQILDSPEWHQFRTRND